MQGSHWQNQPSQAPAESKFLRGWRKSALTCSHALSLSCFVLSCFILSCLIFFLPFPLPSSLPPSYSLSCPLSISLSLSLQQRWLSWLWISRTTRGHSHLGMQWSGTSSKEDEGVLYMMINQCFRALNHTGVLARVLSSGRHHIPGVVDGCSAGMLPRWATPPSFSLLGPGDFCLPGMLKQDQNQLESIESKAQWELERACSTNCLKTTPAENQYFAMRVLIWKSPFFLTKHSDSLKRWGR